MHRRILGAGSGLAALLVNASALAGPCCFAPERVLERFITADCERCWAAPAEPVPSALTCVLDWITPGLQGDAAPLSAAALPEASERLAQLGVPPPGEGGIQRDQVLSTARIELKVVAGPGWYGYFGLELTAEGRPPAGAQAYLALVEDIPPEAEGNASTRRLVRAVAGPIPLQAGSTRELRALRIPEGAKPERLRGVAWWTGANGHIGGVASARCPD